MCFRLLVISDINISWGSVAHEVWWKAEIFFKYKFTAASASEKSLKIG